MRKGDAICKTCGGSHEPDACKGLWPQQATAERSVAEKTLPGLSPGEGTVLRLLVEAWNALLALPREHPDDVGEFRDAIHAAQTMIIARPTRRALNRAPRRD